MLKSYALQARILLPKLDRREVLLSRDLAKYLPDLRIRVAIIEQNPVEREYLLALVGGAPGMALSGAFSTLADALPDLKKEPPDLILVDLEGPEDPAPNWLRQFHSALPHTAVLILAAEKARALLFQTLEAGVSGWLQKPCSADQILRAIIILHEGGAVLSSQVAGKILEYFHARGTSIDCLSQREREVLILLGQGLQLDEIAAKLDVAMATIRTHIRNLLQKLKATSRIEAVAKYLNPAL